jgi:DNA helicase IV
VFVALRDAFSADVVQHGASALDAPVAVLTVADAKGLEFDAVVLLEPADILAESPRGANDLYVAITRPTQRLRVLYSGALPPGFESLSGSR